jgi:hypothetical protein
MAREHALGAVHESAEGPDRRGVPLEACKRRLLSVHGNTLTVPVNAPQARFGADYEFFERSAARTREGGIIADRD